MEPEIIMLSEISQTEKDRYHMFSLMSNLDLKKKKWEECRAGVIFGGGNQPEGQGESEYDWSTP
jgi:hypothetical protein